MKILAQYEIEPRPPQPYEIYGRDNNVAPITIAFIGLTLVVSTVFWFWFWWRLLSKAGYRGFVKGLWVTLLIFPLTSGIGMVALALVIWPVQEQLMKTQSQISKPDDIDDEINRLKRGGQ